MSNAVIKIRVIANQRARWCGNLAGKAVGFIQDFGEFDTACTEIATPVCGLVRNDSGNR